MRHFNTFGPCNPAEHYTAPRRDLIAVGMAKVEMGRYFTIFAPRQAGKTTYFQLLMEELRKTGRYTPIQISFENLKSATKSQFYEILNHRLSQRLAEQGIQPPRQIRNELDLDRFLEDLRAQVPALVLVIDEFEGASERLLVELMHTFRKIYHDKKLYSLHSLMLVGVSTIMELIASSASPFNIADDLKIPYFSRDEVCDLIEQHTNDSGQQFDDGVIKAIYENTTGQPGLVCGLCAHLVDEVATDRSRTISSDDFYRTLDYFLTKRLDRNIINIVQKARAKKAFVMRLLFSDDPIQFNVHNPDIGFLHAHGVVESVDGRVDIEVPLYKKCLLAVFRPTKNGDPDYYVPTEDTFSEYVHEGELNVKAVLQKYVEYVARRGYRAFDTKQLREGAWHYSLDGFINFFIERLGGQTFTEVPSGRGRTDIMILFRHRKYIIETKIFTDQAYYQRGKRQLAEYLRSEGLESGYYVVFSRRHTEANAVEEEEVIDGKRIFTRMIPVKFERPSQGKGKVQKKQSKR